MNPDSLVLSTYLNNLKSGYYKDTDQKLKIGGAEAWKGYLTKSQKHNETGLSCKDTLRPVNVVMQASW